MELRIDGNKRVAFACTILFLQASDVDPTRAEEAWIDFTYSYLEAETFRKDVLEDWLGRHAGPMS